MSSNRQVNFAGPAAPINGTPNGDNRWSSNSADGRLLQSLIETGVITGMSAKTVQMNYPQFKTYANNSFAANLRRFRIMHPEGAGRNRQFKQPTTPNGKQCTDKEHGLLLLTDLILLVVLFLLHRTCDSSSHW
jgi:hypothetical protein